MINSGQASRGGRVLAVLLVAALLAGMVAARLAGGDAFAQRGGGGGGGYGGYGGYCDAGGYGGYGGGCEPCDGQLVESQPGAITITVLPGCGPIMELKLRLPVTAGG